MYRTLLDSNQLHAHLNDPDWVTVDCRFDLSDPGAGRAAYLESHIPGAVYAHLDHELSGSSTVGRGRHPVPSPDAMAALFGRLGIDRSKQVVVYDSSSGSIAARLWWMLRYMGQDAVAVLDGGWPAWMAASLPGESGEQRNRAADFVGEPRADRLVTVDQVPDAPLLIDARDPTRYRGEEEPIDPVAGHIPGAINHFWQRNLDAVGRFLLPETLRAQFQGLLKETPSATAVVYCGSGVTACHNVLALVHAGLDEPRLYGGSWSEWCAHPDRPIATGDR